MITFKAIIIPGNRRKDGTYPVVIRVTFAGKVRRLPTTLVCNPPDVTRTNRIKNPTILNRAEALIAQMRDAVSDLSMFELEGKDVDWVVDYIRAKLTAKTFRLDFFEFADTYLRGKSAATRGTYVSALNAFARYLGKRSVDINSITRQMLLDFVEMVESEGKMMYNPKTGEYYETGNRKAPKGASTRHITKLEHIFNAAKYQHNDEDSGKILIPRAPFAKIEKFFPKSEGQDNLGRELIQKIISYQTDSAAMRTALDVFVVSFGLMGANMADLYNAAPFKGDVWIYNRRKTTGRRADKAEVRAKVPECISPFLTRLRGRGKRWLNVLADYASTKDAATHKVNKYLKEWCGSQGVEPFTLYAARHTFASLAYRQGIDKATIDDCLGHKGNYEMADIYIERDWTKNFDAADKVLSIFDWPEV